MHIKSTLFQQSNVYPVTNHTHIISNEQNPHFIEQFNNVQNKELKKDNRDIVLKEISRNYHVRNATFTEICEISRKLYEKVEISLLDHAILTFDWNKALVQFPERFLVNANSDLHLTPANNDGKRDWIAEFETRMIRNLELNNILGYENNKRVLSILKKFDKQ